MKTALRRFQAPSRRMPNHLSRCTSLRMPCKNMSPRKCVRSETIANSPTKSFLKFDHDVANGSLRIVQADYCKLRFDLSHFSSLQFTSWDSTALDFTSFPPRSLASFHCTSSPHCTSFHVTPLCFASLRFTSLHFFTSPPR